MRGLKSTGALAVILVGLVAYIYFVDSKKPASGTPEAKARVFTAEADQIEEVRITNTKGETSRVQKSNAEWKLVEPEATEADQGQVSNLASSLATLEINRVVDEAPKDLGLYGLSMPKTDVAFRLKGQTEFRHLLVGDETSTGSDMYAKVPDAPRVFLIAAYLGNTFNRSAFDLRDKSVMRFEPDKVETIAIAHGTSMLELHKTRGEWMLTKPYAARADFAAASAILTNLSSAQMQKIVAPTVDDPKRYGFNAPKATVELKGGGNTASLVIGTADADGTFARNATRPIVFTVLNTLSTDLNKPADTLRRKELFDGRSFNTARIELHRGAETFVFERSKDKDGKETWRNAAGAVADKAKVEELLTKLSNIRATAFRENADRSLDSPTLTATVTMDGGRKESVRFARQTDTVFARRDDEPGMATFEVVALNDALAALDALK